MSESLDVKVISLGGSIIAPGGVDADFVRSFAATITGYLGEDERRRVIIVCGGGALAREYQKAYRDIVPEPEGDSQDWIGIAATRVNAELLRHVFSNYSPSPVVTDPTAVSVFPGRVLVSAGWKPGFSTDNVAVLFAEKFFADVVINLSNIARVYSEDPKLNPDAVPIDRSTWAEFRTIVGDSWVPGKNAPFDPVAAKRASEIELKVVVAAGKDLDNMDAILRGASFVGTVIGPG